VLAEYVCFPEGWFMNAPRRLSAAEASTLPCAGTTAWSALIEQGGVQAGQTVLVHGTGGVATFSLKIAQAFGADVIVVSRSKHKLVRTREMGASHNIHRNGDWVEEVYSATNDRGADLIVDTIGGDNMAESLRALAPGGRVAAVGLLGSAEFRGSLGQLGPKAATISAISVGSRQYAQRFVEAIDERDIRPVIDTRYPFAEVNAAFDHLLRGPFGKLVIDVL
jgi:NADPH:quinone reductase-like Zn-dependent oxidoreductase